MENTNSLEHTQKNEYKEEEEAVDLVEIESQPKPEDNDSDNESKPEDNEEETNEVEEADNDQAENNEETEEKESREADDEPVDINVTPYNSITNSMIEITKSQLLGSEPTSMNVEQVLEECHENDEFITSKHSEMIESTYEQKESGIFIFNFIKFIGKIIF